MKSIETESYEPTQFVYPKAYFQTQISFAEKILKLGLSPNIQSSILNYTVIYRHLIGKNPSSKGLDPKWFEYTQRLADNRDLTEQTWQFYIQQSQSIYSEKSNIFPGEYFGSFIKQDSIDKITGDPKIELHFINRNRGQPKSDFSRLYISDRIKDLTRLFQSVHDRIQNDSTFNPKWVTLVSWMNNFPGIKASLPPVFVSSNTIVLPPELNFRSNSLWGQFISNNGGVNIERYQQFQRSLINANNLTQLVESFPFQVSSLRSPLSIFFDYYGIIK